MTGHNLSLSYARLFLELGEWIGIGCFKSGLDDFYGLSCLVMLLLISCDDICSRWLVFLGEIFVMLLLEVFFSSWASFYGLIDLVILLFHKFHDISVVFCSCVFESFVIFWPALSRAIVQFTDTINDLLLMLSLSGLCVLPCRKLSLLISRGGICWMTSATLN